MVIERRLEMKTGQEGPYWDPYSWKERTVIVDGTKTILHTGLVVFCRRGYKTVWDKQSYKAFGVWTGLDIDQFDKALDRIEGPPRKCLHCGSKKFGYGGGYVGETMMWCQSCGNMIWSERVTEAMIR